MTGEGKLGGGKLLDRLGVRSFVGYYLEGDHIYAKLINL
jgi:hypothetical protein